MSHDIERRGMLQGLTAGIVASAVPGRVAAQSPTVLETREIRGDDGSPLNLVTAGQSGGRSILFLHGFSQSYMSFLPQLTDRELGDGFRLAAFDLRGHGASGKPWTSAAYLESRRWAEDIAAVMRAARLDRPLVVAW